MSRPGETPAVAMDGALEFLRASGTARVLAALLLLLVATTAVRAVRLVRRSGDSTARRRWRSIGSWWVLFGVTATVVVLGPWAAAVVGAVVAVLLLTESVPLVRGWGPRGLTAGRAALAAALALMAPGFLVWAAWLPAPAGTPRAPLGWLVATLVLTGISDSAQAWWGRRFGARRLAPEVSPGKTWEGLAGGVVTTALLGIWVLPLLTPLGRGSPAGAAIASTAGFGALLAIVGTLGDLAVSVVKRRAGVDDSGSLVPGQGGLLDRFDSLSATAVLVVMVAVTGWGVGP